VKPPRNTPGPLKVLYATDGSDHAKALGNTLSSLPFPDGSELIVLHVLTTAFEDIPERFAIEINERMKNIVADTREKELKTSQEILEQAVQDAGGSFAKTEKITKFGDPATEILNVADTTGPDIIAIGTSGMRGIKGMIGSVSRYIVNHSRCSLLIAR
jgi:nucleotide-binding universal stress UspA family protein